MREIAQTPAYPECRLTEKGSEFIGRVSVTEAGKKCLNWRSYPYGRPNDFKEIPLDGNELSDFSDSEPSGTPRIDLVYEAHFINRDSWSHHNYCRNPSGKERPWCFVSDPEIQWEYCSIPMCTDTIETYLIQERPWCFVSDNDTKWEYCDIPFCQDLSQFPLYENSPWYFCNCVACLLSRKKDERRSTRMQTKRERRGIRGEAKRGKRNATMSGSPCLPWLTVSPDTVEQYLSRFSDELDLRHGFCRNPNLSDYGPWCYVSDNTEWEYCVVPYCPPSDGEICDIRIRGECVNPRQCKTDKDGRSYLGTTNVTIKGHECLPWMSDSALRQINLQLYEVCSLFLQIILFLVLFLLFLLLFLFVLLYVLYLILVIKLLHYPSFIHNILYVLLFRLLPL
ncbi:unnamed protein product [Darwinula stevensoni]|uniref:Kringle domain-containing protein n=1 Tax=Darwinula stevensoni TaxID=69355 RepID=A0A7R8XCK5_9CRUS|nr:unnamed protein product [Darwinula stevensoni]CAG0893432.1 unnamed protein product [Darwinula stevensoni]